MPWLRPSVPNLREPREDWSLLCQLGFFGLQTKESPNSMGLSKSRGRAASGTAQQGSSSACLQLPCLWPCCMLTSSSGLWQRAGSSWHPLQTRQYLEEERACFLPCSFLRNKSRNLSPVFPIISLKNLERGPFLKESLWEWDCHHGIYTIPWGWWEGQLPKKQNDSMKKSKFLNRIMLLLGTRKENAYWIGSQQCLWFSRHLCNVQIFSSSARGRQAVSMHSEDFIAYFSNSFICLLKNIWITPAASRNFPLVSFLTW